VATEQRSIHNTFALSFLLVLNRIRGYPLRRWAAGFPDMSLTVRRAQAFVKLSNLQDSDDYDVMDGHRRIGRLYRVGTGSQAWCWNISTAITPRGLSGRAGTRLLALQMLSDTYQAVHAINRSNHRPVLPGQPAQARLADRESS
jgi:hypothetical protein